MLLVGDQAPLSGSYNSALATTCEGLPPATRILPLFSRVELCQRRGSPRAGPAVKGIGLLMTRVPVAPPEKSELVMVATTA